MASRVQLAESYQEHERSSCVVLEQISLLVSWVNHQYEQQYWNKIKPAFILDEIQEFGEEKDRTRAILIIIL